VAGLLVILVLAALLFYYTYYYRNTANAAPKADDGLRTERDAAKLNPWATAVEVALAILALFFILSFCHTLMTGDAGSVARSPTHTNNTSVPVMASREPAKEQEGGEWCSICQGGAGELEDCDDDDGNERSRMRELPCEHRFHEECLQEWLRVKQSCPNCRSPVEMGCE
jgi:hypothetical protein